MPTIFFKERGNFPNMAFIYFSSRFQKKEKMTQPAILHSIKYKFLMSQFPEYFWINHSVFSLEVPQNIMSTITPGTNSKEVANRYYGDMLYILMNRLV
jgi:hypothetical protein